MKRVVVLMGEEEMEMNSSFAENGIGDGARLQVCPILLWSFLSLRVCPFLLAFG